VEESFAVLAGGAKSVVIIGKLAEGDLVRAVLDPGSAGTVVVAD
jgi:acetylglutamate kinase